MKGSYGTRRGAGPGRAAWLMLALLPLAVWADEQHPLEPVDNSSPRVVLEGFMSDMDAAWDLIYGAGGETRDVLPEVMILADRILRRLDLSDVAPTARAEEGYDSASHLYEALNRIELPAFAEIPDASAFPPGTGAAEWRIPHTEIVIARRPDSGRPDDFLFTRDTVARANGYYARVKHLPYRRDVPVEDIIRLREIEGRLDAPEIPSRQSLPAPLLSYRPRPGGLETHRLRADAGPGRTADAGAAASDAGARIRQPGPLLPEPAHPAGGSCWPCSPASSI